MLLEIFEALITSMDIKVETFSCPMAYLEYMNSANYVEPAAVFTEIMMPGMSGYQLIEKIREQYPEQRFVTISTYDEGLANAHKAACMHIRKPIHAKILKDVIDVLLRCKYGEPELVNAACEQVFENIDSVEWAKKCPHKVSYFYVL